MLHVIFFKYVLLLLFWLLPVCASAGLLRTSFRHYTIDDGLSNNAVYSIFQDTRGFMWFGTIDGLHRFDGRHFKVFRKVSASDSVRLGNLIYGIVGDEHEQLWIASDMGLSVFSLKEEKFYPFTKRTAEGVMVNSRVYGIYVDSRHNVWIGTFGQGLFCYTPSTGVLKQFCASEKDGISSDYVGRICEDSKGYIWIVTHDNGICSYNAETGIFRSYRDEAILRNLIVFEDSRRDLWVGNAGKGLYRLNRNTGVYEHCLGPKGQELLQIRSIVEYKPGVLLLACDEGMIAYQIETEKSEWFVADRENVRGLNDNFLHALYIDRENGLWIGSYFGGVNYVSPTGSNFSYYSHSSLKNSVGGQIVSSFCEMPDGNLWIGTDDGGVSYWNRRENTFMNYKPEQGRSSLTYQNIHALLFENEKLWIGMYMGGLDVLDLKTGKFKNYKPNDSECSLYSSGVYALYKDSGGELWVGTSLGLNRYNRKKDNFFRIKEVSGVDVTCILEDCSGFLWVTTSGGGVFRLEMRSGEWKHYVCGPATDNSLPGNKVITVAKDDNNRLWFGLDGEGLCYYDYRTDGFVSFGIHEFPGRVVHKIIPDQGYLWISTSNGLLKFNPEQKIVKVYNKYDGLQGNQFSPNAGIKTADGTLFFGGINGFNGFHPSALVENRQIPEVVLTDFRLFNEEVSSEDEGSPLSCAIPYTEEITLTHEQAILSIGFVALSYTGALKNSYAYQLEGFEQGWTEVSGEPRVTYTNLPPGDFRFKVKASNGDGMWNNEGMSLKIKVLPPFWWSSVAIVGYILLMGVVIALLFYYSRLRLKREHREKLVRMEQEKAKELYTSKIEFFTNIVHEIRTPLTLILAPLQEAMRSKGNLAEVMPLLQTVERNGNRLLALVNQLMDFRKMEGGAVVVNCENTDVAVLLDDIYKRFVAAAKVKNIAMLLTLPEHSCCANIDPEVLTKIVSNLLLNALKFTSDTIKLELIPHPEIVKLDIRVEDNGVGIAAEEIENVFKPFYQVKKDLPADYIGTGIGLPLVKKLTELSNGELFIENSKEGGAVFIVRLPMLLASTPCVQKREEGVVQEVGEEKVKNKLSATVMVVDDNTELLDFLRTKLSGMFRVLCAANGEDALKCFLTETIDVVVSDVMMPKMDGMELCRRLKSDLSTSHIPVILLTAKVNMEAKIEGLDNGADVYVEKPFSPDFLKAQINSLLGNRERVRLRMLEKPLEPLTSLATTRADEEFLGHMQEFIECHIEDTDFVVEDIAKELCMSRSGFFAKVRGVSGMTPNDFIRLTRLKKAATLFAGGETRVSEVCFKVGFTSPSYFAKCFQSQFGMLPTDFINKNE